MTNEIWARKYILQANKTQNVYFITFFVGRRYRNGQDECFVYPPRSCTVTRSARLKIIRINHVSVWLEITRPGDRNKVWGDWFQKTFLGKAALMIYWAEKEEEEKGVGHVIVWGWGESWKFRTVCARDGAVYGTERRPCFLNTSLVQETMPRPPRAQSARSCESGWKVGWGGVWGVSQERMCGTRQEGLEEEESVRPGLLLWAISSSEIHYPNLPMPRGCLCHVNKEPMSIWLGQASQGASCALLTLDLARRFFDIPWHSCS